MNDEELRKALVDAAYLEGDFLLRSGKRSRYYLDKFRFSTRPDLLAPLG
ncbi:MAG: orotate phosphoribosyltransferase, partial [Gaiellaceae bacterium]|nr:orotate phosphoribosyltransferase [Gaiellaceae bacterium]